MPNHRKQITKNLNHARHPKGKQKTRQLITRHHRQRHRTSNDPQLHEQRGRQILAPRPSYRHVHSSHPTPRLRYLALRQTQEAQPLLLRRAIRHPSNWPNHHLPLLRRIFTPIRRHHLRHQRSSPATSHRLTLPHHTQNDFTTTKHIPIQRWTIRCKKNQKSSQRK